jgi:formate C-acetyltransferase
MESDATDLSVPVDPPAGAEAVADETEDSAGGDAQSIADAAESNSAGDVLDVEAGEPVSGSGELKPPAEVQNPPVSTGAVGKSAVAGDEGPAAEAPAAKDWYILKVQVNREDSIREALLRRVKIEGLEEHFDEIVVPTEDVAEFNKSGKRRVVRRKLYPGYILVHMAIIDERQLVEKIGVHAAGDASHGGVEFYNLCIDAAGLATVADSFAAVEQRIEKEQRLNWNEMMHFLDTDWAGAEGEKARLMMKNISRYGSGGSRADDFGLKVSQAFTRLVKEKPTPNGYNLIPGIFSWAANILMGKDVGSTPNGRHARSMISHGPNPDPGFRKDGAPSALALTVARVQQGYGNTAPMQIEFDPGLGKDGESLDKVVSLIKTHFALGGTQINLNILDKNKILAAHKDPSKYPDLVVRVTGFSAYFGSLSPEFRQMVVDRIIADG